MAFKRKKLLATEAHIVGHWIFLLGIGISIILGVVLPDKKYIASVLVLMGLLVGFLNIRAKQIHEFLLAAISLIIVAQSLKFVPIAGLTLINIMEYFVILIAPAATVVSIVAVYKLAKGG